PACHDRSVVFLFYAFVIGNTTPFYGFFFFSSRRRHTRSKRDWSSDVCSSDLTIQSIIGVFQPKTVSFPLKANWKMFHLLRVAGRSEERRGGKEGGAGRGAGRVKKGEEQSQYMKNRK